MNLKDKLKRNQLTVGSWLMLSDTVSAEIMAQHRFDWLAIDIEHTSLSYESVLKICQVLYAHEMPCLVRIGSIEPLTIKRVLDSGSQGIIAPNVKSKSDAEKLVSYSYYPPFGSRGVGLYRAQKYGSEFGLYVQNQSNYTVCVVQIEHLDGINALDAICGVEGIDAAMIGPFDLSASLGAPGDFESVEFKEAVDHFVSTCAKNNIPCGFHVVDPDISQFFEKYSKGCNFMVFGIDYMFMLKNIEGKLKALFDKIEKEG